MTPEEESEQMVSSLKTWSLEEMYHWQCAVFDNTPEAWLDYRLGRESRAMTRSVVDRRVRL